MRRPATAAGAVAVAVAAAVALAGCSGAHPTASHAPSPTASPSSPAAVGSSPPATGAVRPALRRFYDQHLAWRTCSGFQCATLTVPVDYAHPGAGTLGVAVIRKPASSTRERSLIINPGGPGASGVDFLRQAAGAFSQLTQHQDLVSFDPRGVGASRPIRCLTSAQLDTYVDTDPAPATAAEHAATVAQAKLLATACADRNGSYLSHVGTLDQARDMDVLRAALGDPELTYYGASYGTFLGAEYAQLFPTHIRAMVLDGAVDPSLSSTQDNTVQSAGFEADLHDFIAACVRGGRCPLGQTTAAAAATVDRVQARVATQPETVGSRRLGPGEFFEGLAAGLYSPNDWPSLQTALGQAARGDGSTLLEFSDSLTGRNPDGSYSNLIESNVAINCIDRPALTSVAAVDAAARAAGARSPHFGAANEYGSLPCVFWHAKPVETAHPVSAPGAPPILVIGTTRDPATPYVWAQSLARQLSSGVLLTYDGDGHTAYLRGDTCVTGVVASYVLSLHPPAAGQRCH